MHFYVYQQYEVLSVLQRAHISGLVIADTEEDALRMAFGEFSYNKKTCLLLMLTGSYPCLITYLCGR